MIGTIRLGNKRWGSPLKPVAGDVIINIDRPNVLGNYHPPESPLQCHVEESVNTYRKTLNEDLINGGPVAREIDRIVQLIKQGQNVILMCWCAPKLCHGDPIVEHIKACLEIKP